MPLSPVREIESLELHPICANFQPVGNKEHARLDDRIDLDFRGTDTQYSTHVIHPYVAAINPPLARALIQHYVPEGATVLDPFCGGGGVLVEALLNRRRAVGFDVNPLAALISRVKTTPLPLKGTMPQYMRIVDEAWKEPEVEDVPDIVRFWYKEDSLKPLRALQSAINATSDVSTRELFQVALSATARDVMLTYRGEVRLRRLVGKDLERFEPNVLTSFRKRAEMAMGRVAEFPRESHTQVMVKDAKSIIGETYHSMISSPPYADDTNGVGYSQFSRNMLYWLGMDMADQKTCFEKFLGYHRRNEPEVVAPPSSTLEKTLEIIRQRKETHYRDALFFYHDYYQALGTISRAVEERAVVIIGDRVLSRTHVNNGHITAEVMDTLGFGLEHYYSRQLRKKRIPNLGGDGGGTSVEHILVFRRRH